MPLPFPDEAAAWLRLTLAPGVSPRQQRKLLRRFGSPQAVMGASAIQVLEAEPRIEAATAEALLRGPPPPVLERALRWLEAPRHHLVALGDAAYPRMLLETADPPCVLYASGAVELLDSTLFAIVGSRNATPQGARDAESMARALSEAGLCIASGLALGIDAAAHRGGLAGRSSSVAVLGTGPDRIYPHANRPLAQALEESGCLVSEFALGTPPLPPNFPRRNRLISGLARGVLVVEAAIRSGSLITAKIAAWENRDVFAMPGSVHAALSKGSHALIKEGAKLVEEARDILEEYRMEAMPPPPPTGRAEDDPLLAAMGFAPVSAEQIALRTGWEASRVAARLSHLEIDGRISTVAGGRFQRNA